MAIPGPGVAISIQTIATEFGGTVPHSLSEYYRGGGLVPNAPVNAAIPTSGTIALSNFYGSSNQIPINLTITGNTYTYDVYNAAVANGYSPGISPVTVTVNPGVIVGSASTGSYAMLVPSAFNPVDPVTIINNGTIQGMGGAGGSGGSAPSGGPVNPGNPGNIGGNALYVNRPTTVTNNGILAGGGGGGGGGGSSRAGPLKATTLRGGGGGGGGAGFNGGGGGAGGPAGSVSGPPGGSGTSSSGGGGGSNPPAGTGGSGGGRGAAGATGGAGINLPPQWSGSQPGGSGGGAGNYIVGNPFVTWPATGTREGGVA